MGMDSQYRGSACAYPMSSHKPTERAMPEATQGISTQRSESFGSRTIASLQVARAFPVPPGRRPAKFCTDRSASSWSLDATLLFLARIFIFFEDDCGRLA